MDGPGPVCFFSRHLPDETPRDMARMLRAVGFDGIELTVRPGGHVDPRQVQTQLPPAVAAIRAEGLEVPVIATALVSAGDDTAAPILAAAARLGVRRVRTGWLSYGHGDVREEVREAGRALGGLAGAAMTAGVELAYQNHVGRLGAAGWDLAAAIEPLDPRAIGVYFDVRHAVAEGTAGSWRTMAHLLAPRAKVVAVKDFVWEGARPRHCPLGQGIVDVPAALAILARGGFRGPIVLFVEYEPPGGDMLAAAARDLAQLRAWLAP
jgi:L-ribulose-5-phosphate 3-epimerase